MNNQKLLLECEHTNCECKKGLDYFRFDNEKLEGWSDQPIFLCQTHCGSHILFPNETNNQLN